MSSRAKFSSKLYQYNRDRFSNYKPIPTRYVKTPDHIMEEINKVRYSVVVDEDTSEYDTITQPDSTILNNMETEDPNIRGSRIWSFKGHSKSFQEQLQEIRTLPVDYFIVTNVKGEQIRVTFHRYNGTFTPHGVMDIIHWRLKPNKDRGGMMKKRSRSELYKQKLNDYLEGRTDKKPKPIFTQVNKMKVLKSLEANGNLATAASVVNAEEKDLIVYLDNNPAFAKDVRRAKQKFLDRLEAKAIERATGYEKLVWFQGKVVGKETDVSERMLLKVLEVNDPNKWGSAPQLNININNQIDPADSAKTKLASMLGLDAQEMIGTMQSEKEVDKQEEDDIIEVKPMFTTLFDH